MQFADTMITFYTMISYGQVLFKYKIFANV